MLRGRQVHHCRGLEKTRSHVLALCSLLVPFPLPAFPESLHLVLPISSAHTEDHPLRATAEELN